MRKISVLLIAYLFCAFSMLAQNPVRVTLKGVVQDTSSAVLGGATVMLLQPKDSALVNFSRANDKGAFEFRNVKNVNYILKISYVGYIPHQQLVSPSANEVVDLGNIGIKPITKELLEVVVRTARAPLTIKGDTIEYDARAFKVPQGSSVEDLLRRLPGMEVDAQGNIKAQGKDIKKVLVDGKTFFGDDPKAATKNLGAETISKVQVFNDKSEQAKLTGVDDGKKEKAINLELKDEYKKGAFGKITGAMGTDSRMALRGNYNRFNKKEQFSILGYGNNINETGVNWSDYGEFKGNNSFNNNDNGDFGFGGNRWWSGDNDVVTNNFDGRGFTNNGGGGVNYNFDNKKTKISTSYFYNQTRLMLDQYQNTKTFLQNNSFTTTDTTNQNNFRGNHSIGSRFEQMVDSNNTVIAKANLRFSTNNISTIQYQRNFSEDNVLRTSSDINNSSALSSFSLTSNVIYRHKFKKKGRTFALSGGYNVNNSDGTENLNSNSKFLNAGTISQQIRALGQLNNNANRQNLLKGSVLYLEPLSKRMYWESFYNVSADNREVGRDAFNAKLENQRMDSLSTYYKNNITYNRLGTSMRYSHAGVNVTVGLAALRFDLDGKLFPRKDAQVASSISKNYSSITPYLGTDIELKSNVYLSVNYNLNVEAPQIADLQPVINNNNPFFISSGNPDLAPEKSHNISAYFNKFDPATFMYVNLWTDYNYYTSQVVYNQTVDANTFVVRTRPENLSGGQRFSSGIYAGFPIVKTKLTVNFSSNINLSSNPTFINGTLNQNDTQGYSFKLGFSLTPSDKLIVSGNGKLGFSTIKYTISEAQNQNIKNNSLDASVKWNFAKKTFLETNLDYTNYRNDRFNFNQDIPILNCSVRRLFLKENKLEVRLAAFDIFNKRQSIIQRGFQNTVTNQTSLTLARYFMLSLTYNLKGHVDKLKKNQGWM
ncbi:TonB-dependent receptor [Arcicella sp. LKC2W]|uniref:TonB-dependent receptor domain-containing protein n=1 Tax=Arcicella sp. LKC2W TaxID=2984198 RepID=UPI002B1F0426|nr:TonB-dependent receptor [Arcicella sp. LKC2W]MEA5460025.1 TonB-dependent receptor [Arcicella sp. LKC2W]